MFLRFLVLLVVLSFRGLLSDPVQLSITSGVAGFC